MATLQLLTNIIRLYGYEPQEVAARQSGYRNHSYRVTLADDRILNLILYKREPDIVARIKRANAISDYLSALGFPSRTTTSRRIIQLRAGNRVQYASLYHYLPGTTIPWEAYTRGHLKLLGATMSSMHHALSLFQPQNAGIDLPKATDEYRLIIERMQRYFSDPGVLGAMHQSLDIILPTEQLRRYLRVLDICDRLPGPHALHLDFVRGNLLFESTPEDLAVSGILDFEKTAYGPPIMDIARTLAFLLVDSKFKTEAQIRKYFLQSGYNKRGCSLFKRPHVAANGRSLDLLEELIDMFLCYDFYKFLRHNPYQSLRDNEHYERTSHLISSRGITQATIPSNGIAVRGPKPL